MRMSDRDRSFEAPAPTPIDYGVPVDTGEIVFEVDMAGDPASRKLALLLHGFPELAYSWRHQIPTLAERGYRVWAPNLRGYGRTTRPVGRRAYATDRLVDDVRRLIEVAGAESVTLVGHDWGGILAWLFALVKPIPIERLVVMNLPHPTLFRRGLRTWKQGRRSWYGLFFQIPWVPEKVLASGDGRAFTEMFRSMAIDKTRFPHEVTEVYRRHALEPGAITAMINWYRGLAFMPKAWRELIASPPRIEVPTLLLWGEEDVALGRELTFGTEELVADLTLRYLPGVSHWVQQEAPETVNAMLGAWLDGLPVPESASLGGMAPGLRQRPPDLR
jgi:pimeloyl-ACP methyl ester carboxylesterase